MNHFHIEGPAQIGFSGGRTSGKMLYEILEAHGGVLPPDVYVFFENTGEEDERTLVFVHEVETRWNVPILWLEYDEEFDIENYRKTDGTLRQQRRMHKLDDPSDRGYRIVSFETAKRNGEPFDKMLRYYAAYRRQVKGEPPVLPNVAQRMCTAYLKIKLAERQMQLLGYDYFDFIVGIRKDEPKRFAKMNAEHTGRFTYVMPLYHAGITKPDVKEFWARQPFDLQLDPNSDEGNCRYCFLKAQDKLIWIMRKHLALNDGRIPVDLQRWVDREKLSGQQFRRNRPTYEQLVQIALTGEEVKAVDEPIYDCICGGDE